MLDRVGIPQPDQRVDDFPHQFSGGMRQRAMIAMGLINDPSLLIADEPTTALDVTVQAQILDLLQDLQREFNSAVIIITHDLGVVAEMADDVLVMYAGRAVEYGTTKQILSHPEMPYTWGLLSSIPDVQSDTSMRGSSRSRATRRACSTRLQGVRSTPAARTSTRCLAACARSSCPSSRRRPTARRTSSAATWPTPTRSTRPKCCPRSHPTWSRRTDGLPEDTDARTTGRHAEREPASEAGPVEYPSPPTTRATRATS